MDKNEKRNKLLTLIIASIIIIITIIVVNTPPKEYHAPSNNQNTSNRLDYSDKYNLVISNVKISHNSLYTECTGTISVRSISDYTYRYIKIKGAFQNSYGKVIDTDWTYAIGSEGLSPGESKSFRMSVPKSTSITDCTVTIID